MEVDRISACIKPNTSNQKNQESPLTKFHNNRGKPYLQFILLEVYI
jgi:hypothetical protein